MVREESGAAACSASTLFCTLKRSRLPHCLESTASEHRSLFWGVLFSVVHDRFGSSPAVACCELLSNSVHVPFAVDTKSVSAVLFDSESEVCVAKTALCRVGSESSDKPLRDLSSFLIDFSWSEAHEEGGDIGGVGDVPTADVYCLLTSKDFASACRFPSNSIAPVQFSVLGDWCFCLTFRRASSSSDN